MSSSTLGLPNNDVTSGTVPITQYVHIHTGGYAVYWVTFGLFVTSALVMLAMTLTRPVGHRKHHWLTTAIVTIAACAYYAMASHGGNVGVGVLNRSEVVREVFYARYIDWFLTTPLLLLDLILLARLSWIETGAIIFADIGMILTGLFGAISTQGYKWGWYTFGCLFFFYILWSLLFPVRQSCLARSLTLGRLYNGLTLWLLVLWCIYPIVWGCAEGGNAISVDAEAAWYAVLDVCAKIVFGFALLFSYGVVQRVEEEEAGTRGASRKSVYPAGPVDIAPVGTGAGVGTGATAGTGTAGTGTAGTGTPAMV